ncbi:MAG TPA: hypothetical protein PLK30_28020, partial [Blastocatellia bacterium]|nr:hypothetical protein [Blastocatellia bacterium]
MKRVFTLATTRRFFVLALLVASMSLFVLSWKGALPGKASPAPSTATSSMAMPPAPIPQVMLNVPQMEFPSQALIGEVFCYTARFDNTGGVGYGPYVEIILPPGLTIDSAGIGGVCNTGNCTQNDFYP